VNLTRTPDISEDKAHRSPEGKQLVFSYRPKAASSVDVAFLDWQTRKVTNLTNEKPGIVNGALTAGVRTAGLSTRTAATSAVGHLSDRYRERQARESDAPPGTGPIRGLVCLDRRQHPADHLE